MSPPPILEQKQMLDRVAKRRILTNCVCIIILGTIIGFIWLLPLLWFGHVDSRTVAIIGGLLAVGFGVSRWIHFHPKQVHALTCVECHIQTSARTTRELAAAVSLRECPACQAPWEMLPRPGLEITPGDHESSEPIPTVLSQRGSIAKASGIMLGTFFMEMLLVCLYMSWDPLPERTRGVVGGTLMLATFIHLGINYYRFERRNVIQCPHCRAHIRGKSGNSNFVLLQACPACHKPWPRKQSHTAG